MLIKYCIDNSLESFKESAYQYALKAFDKMYNEAIKFNPIIFKLHLFMPKLYEIDWQILIIWIYKVELKAAKLKSDNKKQFFYLIQKFQNESLEDKRLDIFIELLQKIQLYIKNAK